MGIQVQYDISSSDSRSSQYVTGALGLGSSSRSGREEALHVVEAVGLMTIASVSCYTFIEDSAYCEVFLLCVLVSWSWRVFNSNGSSLIENSRG